jgi:glyceraldehyde 3-phosphate dehydrogenase
MVDVDGDSIDVGLGKIKVTAIRDPAELPHKALGVDIALECTGFFATCEAAKAHLAGGAKRVLVSAPCDNADRTVVFGVNHASLTAEDLVVSNGSCTTNCLAATAKVLVDNFGIERGYMTTVHAYTGDQRTQDTLHHDLYRGRAAALSIIPTSTGAAKAIGLVIPELVGKLDGSAMRVPTANVSVVDLVFTPGRAVTREEINEAFEKAAAEGPLRGVLAVTNEPLVSIDLNHVAASATVALPLTQVIEGRLARVLAWYDNEWAFSTRMADVALAMGKLG